MKLIMLSAFLVIGICSASAFAYDAKFKDVDGVYYKTPELIKNDKGLICVGYSKEDCDAGEFNLVSDLRTAEKDYQVVYYDLAYSIGKYTCRAVIGKILTPAGWTTQYFKSGQSCSKRSGS
jgi:hypothetical protein